jgi:hypothetical protein
MNIVFLRGRTAVPSRLLEAATSDGPASLGPLGEKCLASQLDHSFCRRASKHRCFLMFHYRAIRRHPSRYPRRSADVPAPSSPRETRHLYIPRRVLCLASSSTCRNLLRPSNVRATTEGRRDRCGRGKGVRLVSAHARLSLMNGSRTSVAPRVHKAACISLAASH